LKGAPAKYSDQMPKYKTLALNHLIHLKVTWQNVTFVATDLRVNVLVFYLIFFFHENQINCIISVLMCRKMAIN